MTRRKSLAKTAQISQQFAGLQRTETAFPETNLQLQSEENMSTVTSSREDAVGGCACVEMDRRG